MNLKKISVLLLSITLVSVNLFGCGERNISDNPDTKKEIATEENESKDKTSGNSDSKESSNSNDETEKKSDEITKEDTKNQQDQGTSFQIPMYIYNSNSETVDGFGQFNLLEVYKDEEALKLVDKHNSFDYLNYDYSAIEEGDVEVEYRVIKYSITLPKDTDVNPDLGTEANVSVYITGLDKGILTYNNTYYMELKTYALRPDNPDIKYMFNGETAECYLFYLIPKGCREYLLELGNGDSEPGYLNSKYIE